MDIISFSPQLKLEAPTAVALGNFDGVHLGHRHLIRETVKFAQKNGLKSAVLTFSPHPKTVLEPEQAPELLTDRYLKREYIARLEPDYLIEIPFTTEFAQTAPETFVKSMLLTRLNAGAVFVGYNYRFGARGSGDTRLLEKLGDIYGVSTKVIAPVKLDGQVVSSSLIRRLLRQGNIPAAVRFLGHSFILRGQVVGGDRRGREIGFPTANLDLNQNNVMLALGVYAVRVQAGDLSCPGVMNVGFCPTFGKQALSVEVHLLDFSGDLYGTVLEVELLQRLREEKTFSGGEQLVAQIKEDIDQAKKYFS